MVPSPTVFEAHFAPASTSLAGAEFRDYQMKRYGPILGAATVINLAALGFVIWRGAEPGAALFMVAFVALGVPLLLFARFYVAGPKLQELRLNRILPPSGTVKVDRDFVVLPTRNGGQVAFAWSKTRVLELPSMFLLVQSPLYVYYVSRESMPPEIEELFKVNSSRRAA